MSQSRLEWGMMDMSMDFDASKLIGKTVKIPWGGEVGVIASFIMDLSGQVKEVLIEGKQGALEKYPVEMLQIEDDEVFLASSIEKRIKVLSQNLPITKKKREVLEKLSKEKIVPQAIFESLVKEFDKVLKEMKSEAKRLIEEIEEQAKIQEDWIKTLQMARAFLEIEHAMGTVSEEIYKRSIVTLLKDIKNSQQRRLELLKSKEKVAQILQEKSEVAVKEKQEEKTQTPKEKGQEGQEEKNKAIPVRIIQE